MIDSDIIYVLGEDRVLVVVGETSTIWVLPEWRLIEVPGDDLTR
jgi:hypothetical protein